MTDADLFDLLIVIDWLRQTKSAPIPVNSALDRINQRLAERQQKKSTKQ